MYEKLGDWSQVLKEEFAKPYFGELVRRVRQEYRTATVYPPQGSVFRAFLMTPYRRVRVVLLGQDPYHGPGQAMGMSFSVPPGVPLPPSLQTTWTSPPRPAATWAPGQSRGSSF